MGDPQKKKAAARGQAGQARSAVPKRRGPQKKGGIMRFKAQVRMWGIAVLVSALSFGTAWAIGIEDVVDGGNTYNWQLVELPGAICSNGSQYRF